MPLDGFRHSPKPIANSTLAVYAAGTAYSLTATPALLNLGTTPASLTLTEPGTYLLLARANLNYVGATFDAARAVTLKLRRTNNTAADVTGSSTAMLTDVITTLTYTFQSCALPPVMYTTANSNDVIQVFGSVAVAPSAGSLDATEAEIIAIKLS